MRGVAVAAVVTVGLALSAGCVAMESSVDAEQTDHLERSFDGTKLTLHLSAGEYEIRGSADRKIRVRWRTKNPNDMRKVKIDVDTSASGGRIETDGPSNNFHVDIELPARCDLIVRLSAGELTLTGVEGHKDVSAYAGELTIGIEKPEAYRSVQTSVWAGELNAAPFKDAREGVFPSFKWKGKGTYDLHARLMAGEIHLREDQPASAEGPH
jgi:hypothetical protein